MTTAEQPEAEEVLSQETVVKRKSLTKNIMSADTEYVLIEGIRETSCLFQKGSRDYIEYIEHRDT